MSKNQVSVLSASYWREAAKPFGDTKMLCLAGLFIALQVVLDGFFAIQLGPNLRINFGFLMAALGATVYGPLMGLAVGAVTDTINALCFVVDTYFFPFIVVEMLVGFISGVVLWRRTVTSTKLIMTKGLITIFCNLTLNTLLLMWKNEWLGTNKSVVFFSAPRFVKNIAMFPLECFLLVVFFTAMLPALSRFKLGHKFSSNALKFEIKHYILLGVMFLIAVAVATAYYVWYVPTL